MKNCARINDGSVECRESYLKNAIINSGQRRNWTRERGKRLPLKYLAKNSGREWKNPIGALTINEFFRRLCSLVVSVERNSGWFDRCGRRDEFDQFMIEEAIEVNSFGNWTKFWREEKVSIKTDVQIFIRFEYFILPFYDYSFTNI